MIKIKVSYEHPEELQEVLEAIKRTGVHIKISNQQKGRFKRAYIIIEPRANHGETQK